MERTRVLHRGERVALEDESGNSHQHREEIVIQGLGVLGEEPGPNLFARSETEGATDVEARRRDRLVEHFVGNNARRTDAAVANNESIINATGQQRRVSCLPRA